MTFLNLFMLFGAAAASIPLLIHLLNRSKYEIVDWGAMHLLQAVIEENNRRIKIYEFLLLLIRCLIPIILALCLARPLVNQFALGGSRGSVQTLVVLDDSMSMSRLDGDQQTRLQRAVKSIESVKGQLGGDSNIRVLPKSSPDAQQTFTGSFDLNQKILASIDLARKDRNTAYEILVVSDFQAANAESLSGESSRNISEELQSLPKRPAITLLPIQPVTDAAAVDNILVTDFEIDSSRIVSGDFITATARLINEGDQPQTDFEVQLFVDGQSVDNQKLTLNANSSRVVTFQHQFTSDDSSRLLPQDHLLTIRVSTNDDCESDNESHQVVTVVKPVRAAVIHNLGRSDLDREEREGESTSSFLMVALSPFAFAGNGESQMDRIAAVRMNGKRMRLEEISEFDVLVLVDPGELDQESIERINSFVTAGGGLLVFAGKRMEQASDNLNRFITENTLKWLPGTFSRRDPRNSNNATIDSNRFNHPSMQLFNDAGGTLPVDAEFERWLKIENLAESAIPIVKLSTGDPLVIERPIGLGTTIFFASTADTTWNNLPLRPAYLPMVQNWTEYLANHWKPEKFATAGTPARFIVSESASSDTYKLISPTGEELQLQASSNEESDTSLGREYLVCNNTDQIGVYRLDNADGASSYFVATPSDDEFVDQLASVDQLEKLAEPIGAAVVTDVEQYFSERTERALGFEVWYWVWWCVLGLLVAERVVVWMLGRIG